MNATRPGGQQDATEERPDEWQLVAASVTGRAHLARDQGNEDALLAASLANGTLLLALADGAGSARNAAEGARLAVDVAVSALRSRLEQGAAGEGAEEGLSEALRGALADVRRAVAERVRKSRGGQRIKPRDLSSTLLLAVISRHTLAVLQLGDGAAIVRSGDSWQRVTSPLRGPHAGETVFATSRQARRLLEVEERGLSGIDAIALLSDGLEPVATDMASGEPHPPFFDPLAAFARRDAPVEQLESELARFLGSERVRSRSSDDLSLILAVRRG